MRTGREGRGKWTARRGGSESDEKSRKERANEEHVSGGEERNEKE